MERMICIHATSPTPSCAVSSEDEVEGEVVSLDPLVRFPKKGSRGVQAAWQVLYERAVSVHGELLEMAEDFAREGEHDQAAKYLRMAEASKSCSADLR
jgi:hypothetical protein